MTDFTKTPQQIIVDLLNADNKTNIAAGALRFGTPQPTAAGAPRNTRLALEGIERNGCVDRVEVRYNRIALDSVPGARSREFDKAAFTAISDIIAAVNLRYGINLVTEDFIDGPLPPAGSDFVVQVKPESLVWLGTLALKLGMPAEDLTNLLFRDTFTGPAGPLDPGTHVSEVGGPIEYWNMVTSYNLDGNGNAVAVMDDVAGGGGGYLCTPRLPNTHSGWAVEVKIDVTELNGAGQYLEIRLKDRLLDSFQCEQLIRIRYQNDVGGTNGPFLYSQSAAGAFMQAVVHEVDFSQALQDAMNNLTVGVHVFRLETTVGLTRFLLDGVEVGKIQYSPVALIQPRCEVNYFASMGSIPWKIDYVKVQGIDSVGSVPGGGYVFWGQFTAALPSYDPFVSYTVVEESEGAGEVTFSIDSQPQVPNRFRPAPSFGPTAVFAEWGGEDPLAATVIRSTRLVINVGVRSKILALQLQGYDLVTSGELPPEFFFGYTNLQSVAWHNCTTPTKFPDPTPAKAALKNLEVYESNLYGPFPTLANYTQLNYLDIHSNYLSGAAPDVSGTVLTDYNAFNNWFTDFTGGFPNTIANVSLFNNRLTQAAVDRVLAALVAANSLAADKSVDLSGGTNATPGASGLASVAALQAAGWTVTTN